MRIVQLANFVGPTSGGMKTAVEAIGAGYVRHGVERLLVVPGARDDRWSTEHGDVVQVRAPRVGDHYRLIVEPWRVLDVLESFGPTSVEVHDKTTLLPVARWARRRQVGAVLFSHERMSDMMAMRTRRDASAKVSIALLNRVLVRSFDQVVVTSDFAREELAPAAGAAGCPVVTVPLGVDLERFRARGHRRPGGPVRLVLAGRLSREKSPHLAVATAVELHRRGVDVRLDVYGTGPHLDELQALAGSAPVTFHGHVAGRDELAARLAAADVALSVCPSETFGLAVLEALACGTPVVTADVGGARELVHESCGAWAAPDPVALADAVQRVVAVPVRTRRRAARQRAERYPWSTTVDQMLSVHRAWARPRLTTAG
ncbi:glycosyltransferase family 4 protein [Aeromicrobium sp. Leaf350]|uniref:glycosyltransferase family 4 protein n=1 Tax=Aeromicrobium sp. Leaf350 TaxID=2876565 RepID=UPI001E5456D5|nr:glycosyltransferase family 4 protein [Aeromicrobium sp. Leaf350]